MKKIIVEHLHSIIDHRIETAQAAVKSAEDSKNSETKSSAGDKFETGRAMMQLEQEKNEMQLGKALQLKGLLSQVDFEKTFEEVAFGSLVDTNRGKYFIAIGIGKVEVESETVFAISADSPIGKLLIGRKVGESVEFRGNILIKELF